MTLDLRSLEMAGHRTWPAFHEEWSGDWIIRATAGMSRRNNSVTPMGRADVPVAAAIDWAEAWFTEHEIPPIFRITDLAPAQLPRLLERRGYRKADTTVVMVRPIGRAVPDPEVEVTGRPTPEWLDILVGEGTRSPEHRHTIERLLSTSPAAGFAHLHIDGAPVAIGSTAVAGAHAAIFNMNTRPPYRRRGIATRILNTLLAHAAALGASIAMLQVRQDNPSAIALYGQEGFERRYDYWYYEKH